LSLDSCRQDPEGRGKAGSCEAAARGEPRRLVRCRGSCPPSAPVRGCFAPPWWLAAPLWWQPFHRGERATNRGGTRVSKCLFYPKSGATPPRRPGIDL